VIDEVGTLAEFWPKIRAQYPGHDKQPPLPPATEIFETPATGPELQFQVMHGAPPQRYWFLSEDGTQIVQVQNDRLMFNWRQVSGSEPYPRYATLAPQFSQLLETFLTCKSVDREAAEVTWVELQYVNPINAPGFDGTHWQLARILNFLVQDPPRMTLPRSRTPNSSSVSASSMTKSSRKVGYISRLSLGGRERAARFTCSLC
jgi:uncharacterized protein (TIGR04255 family)